MENILIVDDEPGVIEIISEVLESSDFRVKSYTDPVKAVKDIQSNFYDIVITDLKMPKVDGIQVTKAVKKANKETEVIVITGYASLESAIEALKQDVFDYIFKPFNISEILMTVKKVSERIRLKRTNLELSKTIEKALADISILNDVSKIINTSEEMDEVLSFGLSTIETSLDINVVSIMLFDEKNEDFCIEKSIGLSKKTISKFRIKLGEGIIGQAIRPNETVDIDGFKKDENFKKNVGDSDKKKIKSFIAIPLNAQNKLVGLFIVNQFDLKDNEDQEKLKLLEVMAVQIAPMIRLGQYNEERKALLTDPLSGAKNELFNIIKKAGEYRGTLSILIFKLYLKKNANFNIKIFDIGELIYGYIQKNITPIDSAVKIGLDSFMVILQGKTKILTEKIASKIKEQVEEDASIKGNDILLDFGYSDFPMDGQTFDVLVSKAQASLWKFAKK
ncbi:response regulator [candidate division KSB1 bacterium]